MNSKTLAKLVGVLVVLIAAVAVLRFLSRPSPPKRLTGSSLTEKTSRVEISGPLGNVILARSSSTWTVQFPIAYPADASGVQGVLDRLHEVNLSEEFSQDASRDGVYELNAASATRVKIYVSGRAEPSLDFMVGKAGAEYDSFFLKFQGKPGVVEASGIAAYAFRKAPEDWFDKAICQVRPESVTLLSVKAGPDSVTFRRSGSQWFAGKTGSVLSTATVSQLISPALDVLSKLVAERVEILAPDSKRFSVTETGLSHPDLVVRVEGSSGDLPIELRVGKKDASIGYRYIQKSGETRVFYRVSDWRWDSFRKKDLFKVMANGGGG